MYIYCICHLRRAQVGVLNVHSSPGNVFRHTFWKVPSVVPLHSNCSRALTFENMRQERQCCRPAARGSDCAGASFDHIPRTHSITFHEHWRHNTCRNQYLVFFGFILVYNCCLIWWHWRHNTCRVAIFFFGFIWVYNRCLMKPQTLWHDITISITSQYVLWYLVNCVRCNETQTLSHDVTMSIAWCDKLYCMMWQCLITFQSILQSFRFVNFD